MLNASRQTARIVDFERAMEGDGLWAITFWFEGGEHSYLSMCCGEDAGSIYIESVDQIHGFETDQLAFEFQPNNLLILALADGSKFPATAVSRLEIEFPAAIELPLRRRIEQMISKKI